MAFGDERGQSAVDELVSALLVSATGSGYVVPPLVAEFAAGRASVLGNLAQTS